MTIIHARTGAEAREYMVLALPECGGDVTVERGDAYAERGLGLVQKYLAGCADAGVRREFEFVTDEIPEGTVWPQFGYGPQPSTLIDAGQWYLIFARYTEAGRAIADRFLPGPPDLESAEQVYEWYSRAWGALGEVLKFLPPDVDDAPDSAFWTPQGREIREQYGSQLTRPVLAETMTLLERALQTYRDAYA
jgi:hypothetical protein